MEVKTNILDKSKPVAHNWRSSSETILPQHINNRIKPVNSYDIYPSHTLGDGKIYSGYETLVDWIIEQKTVRIDGYVGVFWDIVEHEIHQELLRRNVSVKWSHVADKMKGNTEIQQMVQPFLGEAKSVWGKRTTLTISDFFHQDQFSSITPDENYEVNLLIGVGAALVAWEAPIIYLEIPKSEIQYRFRAGAMTNFGSVKIENQKDSYKRSYFVDWVILNEHKAQILDEIIIIVDAQWRESINWAFNRDLQRGLKEMSESVFRVRPWFEAGAWGGHWMQNRIDGLNKDEVNYAWSFELIVPENGIVFESDGNLLEVSFDLLMFSQSKGVLGKHAAVFGTEFPIRFDFLDTFDGGNLSIQCHPSLEYIRKEFGENITQDETYYILDCKDDAEVFLGFQEDIDPAQLKQVLEESQAESKEIDIKKFVQTHQAKKHDLFLIPNGTVHSAGSNNLVLEISATPYIFTFKMYDWMRLGLDGHPRPINIDHAFNNLKFDRKGEKVIDELISKQTVIEKGPYWELIHVPTHADHFYDVHRMEFDFQVTMETNNVCHILMLVEGTSIKVQTADGTVQDFHYAETFVIPAAAKSYTLVNTGNGKAKVVKAFVKDGFTLPVF
jgi:mannose-6-phosphate isomerase class I